MSERPEDSRPTNEFGADGLGEEAFGKDADLSTRVQELLAGKVLGDLSDQEQDEISNWQETEADLAALFDLEKTAAAVDMALSYRRMHDSVPSQDAEPPSALMEKIQAESGRVLAEVSGKTGTREAPNAQSLGTALGAEEQTATAPNRVDAVQPRKQTGLRVREAVAWLAFAASALLAFGLWRGNDWNNLGSGDMTAAAKRMLLLSEAEDLVQVAWGDGKHPFETKVAGDVVWSNTSQDGYMLFIGMPINDVTLEQYQLWIIDPERDDEPIDGGVFDIASTGEVVVPISAKLKVLNPVAFAITVEKPGGVVVSTQENLPLLAALQ